MILTHINMNDNIKNIKYSKIFTVNVLTCWGLDYNYVYGIDFTVLWNNNNDGVYVSKIVCNEKISDHLRAVWKDDDNLYVLNPKFQYVMEIKSPDINIRNLIQVINKNKTNHSLYYRYNPLTTNIRRFISSSSLEDQVMFKMRYL